MNRKTASILELELAYYEKPGKSGTIMFIHGNSGSAANFEMMWNHAALKEFHLIAIDLPGHGNSAHSKNHDDYRVLSLSKFVAALIDKLALDGVAAVGHSLGGNLAIHAAQYSSRVAGVMALGAAPIATGEDVAGGYTLNEDITPLFGYSATKEQLRKAIDVALHNKAHQQFFLDSFAQADGHCRETVGADLGAFFNSPDFKSEIEILNDHRILSAIAVGEFEPLVNAEYVSKLPLTNLWGGKVHKIKGAGHCPPFENPDATAEFVASFAKAVHAKP